MQVNFLLRIVTVEGINITHERLQQFLRGLLSENLLLDSKDTQQQERDNCFESTILQLFDWLS